MKIVVAGALPVTGEERVFPHAAGLIGLARAAGAEHPRWSVGCVDVGPTPLDVMELAGRIRAETCADGLVALRDGRRLVRVLEPAPAVGGREPYRNVLEPAPAVEGREPYRNGLEPAPVTGGREPYRNEGVYLILGGTGGIGLTLSRHLARTVNARLVSIGRGPEGTRIAQRIAEIEELGGRVLYVRADAADPVALRGAVASAREFFGPVQGAFHAALVLHDTTLANMDEAALAEVLLPKVAGAAAFADALRDEPLDFLAFFSSAASFVDAAGQANYAAASTFEDSYALSLRRQGMPVSVMNWGYWGSVGAVSGGGYETGSRLSGSARSSPPKASPPSPGSSQGGCRRRWSSRGTRRGWSEWASGGTAASERR